MISTIYIEQAVHDHPRSRDILSRFPEATVIPCNRYNEVFNRKAQNFRLQKKRPALILARKSGKFVLPTPTDYGIGSSGNYYFSHMLNCIYDCRYCFLQGMFRSAHYVLFVNYEDFADAILEKTRKSRNVPLYFFSGYDCDSMALEPVTGFCSYFLPLFRENPEAVLELRTKSTQIRPLLDTDPIRNCIVAFSFTPAVMAAGLEHRTPAVKKRIEAMSSLQRHGWRLGLRFDPLIFASDYKQQYESLFREIFARIDPENLHSVSLGSFRLPAGYYRQLVRMYPDELFFAGPIAENGGMAGYKKSIENEMLDYCSRLLLQYIPEEIFFPSLDTVT